MPPRKPNNPKKQEHFQKPEKSIPQKNEKPKRGRPLSKEPSFISRVYDTLYKLNQVQTLIIKAQEICSQQKNPKLRKQIQNIALAIAQTKGLSKERVSYLEKTSFADYHLIRKELERLSNLNNQILPFTTNQELVQHLKTLNLSSQTSIQKYLKDYKNYIQLKHTSSKKVIQYNFSSNINIPKRKIRIKSQKKTKDYSGTLSLLQKRAIWRTAKLPFNKIPKRDLTLFQLIKEIENYLLEDRKINQSHRTATKKIKGVKPEFFEAVSFVKSFFNQQGLFRESGEFANFLENCKNANFKPEALQVIKSNTIAYYHNHRTNL